jgi:RNA polymerase sigma factor for flagellar operon FliA
VGGAPSNENDNVGAPRPANDNRLRPLRDRLIQTHLPRVRRIARQVRDDLKGVWELDDLIGYGAQGLIEAAGRFDPARGTPFMAFALPRIRGAIIDGIRRMAYLPRVAHAKLRTLGEIDPELDVRALVYAMHAFVGLHSVTGRRADLLAPDETVELRQCVLLIRRALPGLRARERRFLELHYFEGRSLTEAAGDLGLSPSWASRIHTRAIATLRRRLTTPVARVA